MKPKKEIIIGFVSEKRLEEIKTGLKEIHCSDYKNICCKGADYSLLKNKANAEKLGFFTIYLAANETTHHVNVLESYMELVNKAKK